jgi:hypothetical protein
MMKPSTDDLRAGVIIIGHQLDAPLGPGVVDRLVQLGMVESVDDQLVLTKRGEVPLAQIETGDDDHLELNFE